MHLHMAMQCRDLAYGQGFYFANNYLLAHGPHRRTGLQTQARMGPHGRDTTDSSSSDLCTSLSGHR